LDGGRNREIGFRDRSAAWRHPESLFCQESYRVLDLALARLATARKHVGHHSQQLAKWSERSP
jgi:hypothetical protein